MHIDTATTAQRDNYKLLTNLVVPRPIAWVTSQNEQGMVNLAPFSFFNAVSSKPIPDHQHRSHGFALDLLPNHRSL